MTHPSVRKKTISKTTGNKKHVHMSTSPLKQYWNITHRCIFRLTWHALFGDLSVVDLLLQCEVAHQPVDVTRLPLTVAVDAAHGLGVVARVPGGVEHHHAVRSDQVYTQTTSPGAQRGHVILWPNLNISLLLFSSICNCCFYAWGLPGWQQEDPCRGVGRVIKLVYQSLSLWGSRTSIQS